ncbi:alpha/beta-hydrolase [Xylariaceae sp. FL0662B]|nr:alpha/beta-hydrolase [Xylariaceae sp. FL0662B]
MAASLKYAVHAYGSAHELQHVGVWDLDTGGDDASKYWIIYIHGGAWRDPRVGLETFEPSITRMLESGDSGLDAIAAFASIDYRLSAHPEFPQNPATTPPAQFRNAIHPDHLDDVRAALVFLQRRHGFGARYVLVGHSAGACLAYQLVADARPEPAPPEAILGFEGIYDLGGLNARVGGAYAGFMTAAFGAPGRAGENWDAASPAKYAGDYRGDWAGGRVAVAASSPDDTLVDEVEADGMAGRLRRDGVEVLRVRDLHGDHDEIWRDGSGIATTVFGILRLLRESRG